MTKQRLVLLVAVIAGCGIDESGLQGDSGADVSLDAKDSGFDVAEEPASCAADAGAASCADAAAFRAPALYSADAGALCPPGYDSLELVNATPQSANCTCNCTDGGPPACDTTAVTLHTGNNNCTDNTHPLSLSGMCTMTGLVSTDNKVGADTPKVVGGCGGGTAVPPALNQTGVRLCVPQCASDESVCNAHPGLQACVYVAKNAGNCPPGYGSGPFYVGASPSTLCDNCSCSEMGDCTGMQFHYFTSSTNCTGGDQHINMDLTCSNVNGGPTIAFTSMNIQGSIKTPSCNVSPTFSHVGYGSNDYTVCCK